MPSGSTSDSDTPVTITGQVINAVSNMPLARALVRMNGRAMLTAYNGKFEFDQVSDPTGLVQASRPGFYGSSELGGPSGVFLQTIHVITPLVLRLYPEAIFTGIVTEPDGDPLVHVVVSARRSMFNSSGHIWIPVAQTQTDSHGRFRLTVPAGDYKLVSMYISQINGTDKAVMPVTLPAENSLNTSGFFHIRSGEEQQYNLHPAVSRAYSVTAVFDSAVERGFPRIIARSSTGSTISLPVHSSRRDEDGTFKLELPSGTYTLIASVRSTNGIVEGETSVTVGDHDLSGVIFHLEPVPTLPVEIQADGAATSDNTQPSLMQFGLMLENSELDPDNLSFPIPLTAQRGGAMSFTASPGIYHLRARNNQGAWYIKSATYGVSDLLQQEFVVGPGAGGIPIRVTVSNQTASLQGTCALSGIRTACWVYLRPTTPSASTVFTVRSNDQGVYHYGHLPPGSYQAVAFEQMHSADYSDAAALSSFATHVRAVTVSEGEKPTLDLDTVSEAEMAP
ncbi:MAG: carboxypeptidase-like regulatory domain-containing protein [Edaphobacter sp.]